MLKCLLKKDNGDVEFVFYYYKSGGSRYPLTNSKNCVYSISTPVNSPNIGDTVSFFR